MTVSVDARIQRWTWVAASVVALAVAALWMAAEGAWAGRYHVYSCRTPSGEPAPVDGWSGSVAPGSAFDTYATNTCAEGGALVAALGDQTTHAANTDGATWVFESPVADKVTAATLWRAGDTDGGTTSSGTTYGFVLSGPGTTAIFDECIAGQCDNDSQGEGQDPFSAANRVAVPGPNLGPPIYVNVACAGPAGPVSWECQSGQGDASGYAAVVYVYAADIVLEQQAGPSDSDVGGELASGSTVSGTSDVVFDATDPGAGVYEAVFTVDGQVVQSSVIDENGGRCRNVGQTTDGLAAFLYLQPCPGSVNADVGLDTTRLGNGSHHLVVTVVDAAGNSATVLDRQITVVNPPAPAGPGSPGAANGTNASAQATLTVSWKGTRKERLTSAYGRSQTIVGRLTGPGGMPIGGAQIGLQATPAYDGARVATLASPVTDVDGSFTMRLPGDVSSRTLRFSYRAHLGETEPVAARTLTETVRAGLRLSVSPHTASVGSAIFFHGRLEGGPVPSDGKQLVLEARSPGGPWIEFDVVRSDARGRYRASYRFKFPGPADYQFRVLSEPESDYPFAAGSSNLVEVHER
jgi:hypothetical protein